jgi:tRNA pseudouridine32 synthase/23S rRNA pseudouridine746 synthase
MGVAQQPSVVTMPKVDNPPASILEFLCSRFPAISRDTWAARITTGNVRLEGFGPIRLNAGYIPLQRIFYYREVATEPCIPFSEKILHLDDHLLVACKPHFLPVTPGGRYVEECLLNRLRKSTGIEALVPLHRIDRETAGLVLFSTDKKSRGCYGELFQNHRMDKIYHARAACLSTQQEGSWQVENRIERGEPWFRMKVVPGAVNARSVINLVEIRGETGCFVLHPETGKTHQLRLHMAGLGFGILNDRYYPELQEEREDDFDTPLQLVAKELRFTDPLTGIRREFVSERELLCYSDGLPEETPMAASLTS